MLIAPLHLPPGPAPATAPRHDARVARVEPAGDALRERQGRGGEQHADRRDPGTRNQRRRDLFDRLLTDLETMGDLPADERERLRADLRVALRLDAADAADATDATDAGETGDLEADAAEERRLAQALHDLLASHSEAGRKIASYLHARQALGGARHRLELEA